MKEKEYYVIQNKEGKFFKVDNITGGYPFFTDDFEFCERFHSKESASNFLTESYATKQFPKEFSGAMVKTIRMTLID